MIRIYFDTNVYASYKRDEKSALFGKLLRGVDDLYLICYSQAHLNDLAQDKSDKKNLDLQIIEKFCQNNFLQYNFQEDRIVNLLATPQEAYEHFAPDKKLFRDLMTEAFDSISEIGNLREILSSQFIDLGLSKHPENNTPEAEDLYQRFGITKDKYSMYEWIEVVGTMIDNLSADSNLVRDARRISKQVLKWEKFNVNIDDVEFDKNLSRTRIGKSFTEFLEQQVENLKDKDGSTTAYVKFTIAYNLLVFLGLDSERNRNVKFDNTKNDAEHFLYGTVCDYLVSSDAGLINKANFLYRYFGLDCIAITPEQLDRKISLLNMNQIRSLEDFLESLNFELRNSSISSGGPSIRYSQTSYVIKTPHKYLFYFNRISSVVMHDDEAKYILLYQDGNKIFHHIFRKEFRAVTNRTFEIFGVDDNGLMEFEEYEFEELKDGTWLGRTWTSAGVTYRLMINPESKRINLQIGPLN